MRASLAAAAPVLRTFSDGGARCPTVCYRVQHTKGCVDTMALTESGLAPYAPIRSITALIEQYREKTLPTPITNATIMRLGIEESLSRRAIASLKILDLIDENGEPTPTLKKLRVVPSDELTTCLAEWFRDVYKPILTYVEPTDDVVRIADQFRHYEPAGQRNRMVSLFLGLAKFAGLLSEVPTMPRTRTEANGVPQRRRIPKTPKPEGDVPPQGDKATQKAPPAPQDSLTEARQRYVDMLIKMAGEADTPDAQLLDRIERALGIPSGGSTP
jgi:hypothetical protein